MFSYHEKLLILENYEKELNIQELELMRARERLAIDKQQLEAQQLSEQNGLTSYDIDNFQKAIKTIIKTITADEVVDANLTLINEPSSDHLPYSIDISCCYVAYEVAGMSYTINIRTINPAIVSILRSMIRQESPSQYEPCDESTRTSWRVYWDNYDTITLND